MPNSSVIYYTLCNIAKYCIIQFHMGKQLILQWFKAMTLIFNNKQSLLLLTNMNATNFSYFSITFWVSTNNAMGSGDYIITDSGFRFQKIIIIITILRTINFRQKAIKTSFVVFCLKSQKKNLCLWKETIFQLFKNKSNKQIDPEIFFPVNEVKRNKKVRITFPLKLIVSEILIFFVLFKLPTIWEAAAYFTGISEHHPLQVT